MNEEELEKKISGFGAAPLKMEGKSINSTYGFSEDYEPTQKKYETTYLEVSIPVALEEMAWAVLKAMRTQWLIDNGFEEIKYEKQTFD